MLAGLLLGSRLGTVSVLSYMLLGLAGLPIFSEGGGLWYVFKPSFGYIIGFAVGTFVTGWIAEHMEKKTIARYLLANLAGLFCVYAVAIGPVLQPRPSGTESPPHPFAPFQAGYS